MDEIILFFAGISIGALGTTALLFGWLEKHRTSADRRALSAMKEQQLLSIKNANDYANKVERVCYDYAGFVEELANSGALSGGVGPLRESVAVDGEGVKGKVGSGR